MVAVAPTLLMLADYGGLYGGSFVPMLRALAGEARDRGWGVECGFTPVSRGRPWLADLAADQIPFAFAPSAERVEIRRWIADLITELPGPVIVHAHFTAVELPSLVALGSDRAAVIWHVHTYMSRRPDRLAKAIVKYAWLARRVSFICVSEATAAAIRGAGARRRRTTVIENGIDSARFTMIEARERRAARERLGVAEGVPVLLHVGWDWEAKGGPLFSAGLARLRTAGSDAVGISVGGGEAAREASARLGLGDALLAVEPDADVRRFYAAADALVATSHGEGAPFAMLEALSSGIAVVATEIPGHLLEPDPPVALRLAGLEPDAVAEAARQALARSPQEREAEAREAHAWVSRHRGLERTASEVATVYEAALARL